MPRKAPPNPIQMPPLTNSAQQAPAQAPEVTDQRRVLRQSQGLAIGHRPPARFPSVSRAAARAPANELARAAEDHDQQRSDQQPASMAPVSCPYWPRMPQPMPPAMAASSILRAREGVRFCDIRHHSLIIHLAARPSEPAPLNENGFAERGQDEPRRNPRITPRKAPCRTPSELATFGNPCRIAAGIV